MNKIILAALLLILSCSPKKGAESSIDHAAYKLEIEAWHKKRVDDLKGPSGWLNLAGLYWLEEGINTFGSSDKNSLVFPSGKIADRAGFFLLKQNIVTVEVAPGVKIISEKLPVKSKVIYHPDSSRSPVLEYESLQWFVIKRDNKYGIRLRDFKNPKLEGFHGIERYPIDATWRAEAKFEKSAEGRTIEITNILGQTIPQLSPGSLIFTLNGKKYRLDALDEGGEDYFMIFGDKTNTKETYGAGRYLYVEKPDASGKTIIDFNKAYNPPCAFTEFATCPLPPRQNILDIEIKAGEKNYTTH